MVIRHSVKELLAKNSATQPMKYIVGRSNEFTEHKIVTMINYPVSEKKIVIM